MRRLLPVWFLALACIVTVSGCAEPPAAPRAVDSRPPAAVTPTDVGERSPAPGEPGPSTTGLDDLIGGLVATDPMARVAAIDGLAALGQNAKPALDQLVALLADADPLARWHAARAVGLIGEDARAAIPQLVRLLADRDPITVAQAAAAIGLIRADDGRETMPEADEALYAAAVDPLVKTTVHPDPRARRAAVRALHHLTQADDQLAALLVKQLDDADPSVVMPALHTLADMEQTAVPFLREALRDPKSRYWAELAVAEIGPEAADCVDQLVTLAGEGPAEDRLPAIFALAAIGAKASAAVPVLGETVVSGDEILRSAAAFALGSIGAKEADAVLEQAAASDDRFLSTVAAWARARVNPGDGPLLEAAVARLRTALAGDDPELRASAVSGLSDLAASLPEQTRAELAGEIAGLLTDESPKVAVNAGGALVRLGPAAVDVLRAKLADPRARVAALELLGAIGPAAKPALTEMLAGLDDADPAYRGDAAVAIAGLGADAAAAVPALEQLLNDETVEAGARYAAAYALGRIGPAAASAEPALRRLAESSDELMATVAVWAAIKIKPNDGTLFEAAIPRLRRALRGDGEMVRLEAAVALGEIGAAARSAVPLLELVAEDDASRVVREAAAAALVKIKGG